MSVAQLLARLNSPLARTWYAVRPGGRILMYHRITDAATTGSAQPDQLSVSPALFAEQIRWLNQHKRILPLGTLLEQVGTKTNTRDCVAITFDDGYLDNLQNALPVLEQYKAAASIYITTDFAAQKSRHKRYTNETGRLHLDWQEVHMLARHPLIEIGSHTLSHPMLSELSSDKAETEIRQSKEIIEHRTEMPIDSFCYPAGNFTAREYDLVKTCGYQNALSVKPGVSRTGCDLYALRRTEITWKDSPANLKLKLEGGYDLMHTLLDIRRERIFARRRRP